MLGISQANLLELRLTDGVLQSLLTLDYAPDCILVFTSSIHKDVQPTFQIGELAKRTSLSIDAIRFYERRKLLPTPSRSKGGFRLYSTDDIERLHFVRQVQGLGFSLQDIKKLMAIRADKEHACGAVRDFLKTKLADVAARIRKLQQLETELKADLRKCTRSRDRAEADERGGR